MNNEEEHRNLWDAINGLRDERSVVQSSLARIEAMLSERCEARMSTMQDMKTKQEEHDNRLKKLEELRAQILLLSAIGAVVGGGAVSWIFKFFGS